MEESRVVKIKTWDEMKKEFGINNNEIKCQYSFTNVMEDNIPSDRIIIIKHNGTVDKYKGYSISQDMIEYEIPTDKTQYKTLTIRG